MSPDTDLSLTTVREARQRLETIATAAERAEALAEKTARLMYAALEKGEEVSEPALLVAAGRLAELGRTISHEAVALAADTGGEDISAD